MASGETLEARKVFHVSPFCTVSGRLPRSDFASTKHAGSRESTISTPTIAAVRCSATSISGVALPLTRELARGAALAVSLVHRGRHRPHPLAGDEAVGQTRARSSRSRYPRQPSLPADMSTLEQHLVSPPELSAGIRPRRPRCLSPRQLVCCSRCSRASQRGTLALTLPDGTTRHFGTAEAEIRRRAGTGRSRAARLARRVAIPFGAATPGSPKPTSTVRWDTPDLVRCSPCSRRISGRSIARSMDGRCAVAAAPEASAATRTPGARRGATSSRTTISATRSIGPGSTRR